ncbi:MAG: HEPN domain-containing protein [Candidatus Thorarchaeota archaeon]
MTVIRGMVMLRAENWLKQAKNNLEHAVLSHNAGHYEWACFAAQQAAEMAVNALFRTLGADAWGHSVARLLRNLPDSIAIDEQLLALARTLDRHYVPARYPNGLPAGTPREAFDGTDAEEAIRAARSIVEFCESEMAARSG